MAHDTAYDEGGFLEGNLEMAWILVRLHGPVAYFKVNVQVSPDLKKFPNTEKPQRYLMTTASGRVQPEGHDLCLQGRGYMETGIVGLVDKQAKPVFPGENTRFACAPYLTPLHCSAGGFV